MNQMTRIARGALLGGGSIGVVGLAAAGLLRGKVSWTGHGPDHLGDPPPDAEGVYGARLPGEPLILAVLGDATAAGLGAQTSRDTPGALVAAGLAHATGRPVCVVCLASATALSPDLYEQVELALPHCPDLALVMTGSNDVARLLPIDVAVRPLARAVRTLRDYGVRSVVGTCPDLSTGRRIQPPLRWLAGRLSRELARMQETAVIEAGGRAVQLADLAPYLARHPEYYAADRHNLSGLGYAAAAAILLPAVREATEELVQSDLRRAA